MKFSIIGMSLFSGFVFLFTNYKNKLKLRDKGNAPELKKYNSDQTRKNKFEEHRNATFITTPEQLGLTLVTEKAIVYGIVMDWGMDDSTATVVSYQTGDAGLYLSTGGSSTGDENLNTTAKQFVLLAQNYLSKATKTETNTLPGNDMIKFHFLTNNGIYAGQEKLQNLEENASSWLPLFEKGNEVLTELRLKN